MSTHSRQRRLGVPVILLATSEHFGLPRHQRTPEEFLVDDPSAI